MRRCLKLSRNAISDGKTGKQLSRSRSRRSAPTRSREINGNRKKSTSIKARRPFVEFDRAKNMPRRGNPLLCLCRAKLYAHQWKTTEDPRKRKRRAFVYNPEEEIWHEPYMQTLRREFSVESVPCDSKIELPWRDIALPTATMRIRPDVTLTADRPDDRQAAEIETVRREAAVTLPWRDLLITETLRAVSDELGTCDSAMAIPWSDLVLERPLEIRAPREERRSCAPDDVEIPWDEILVPRNIVIEPGKRRKRSPSPGRRRADATCVSCGTRPCCARTRVRATCK